MNQTITTDQAAEFLNTHDDFLILTHKRPDGDTIGCAAALCTALREWGRTAFVLPNPEITAAFTDYFDGLTAPDGFVPDTVVAVDIAALGLLPDNAKQYSTKIDLAVDHHPSQEFFAARTCLEASRAACGEIVYEILRQWGDISPAVAAPLYVAVSTDCGCFVYANTTANTHRVAAALMETGIDTPALNKKHFRTKSLKRLKLESLIMERLELYQGGTIAAAAVSQAMMDSVGATVDDLDDLAAFVGQIQGVLHSMTVRELADGTCKVSLRTNARFLNATKVCAKLGGGGHAAASGCTAEGSLQEVIERMLRAIEEVQREDAPHSVENR